VDLFKTDPERERRNATMNELIAAQFRSKKPREIGGVQRLTAPVLGERLSGALNGLDAAERAGDEIAKGIYENAVGKLVDEARAARAQREAEQPDEYAGFNGGSGRKPPPGPGGGVRDESSGSLLLRAITQRRVERSERGAEGGVVTI
jgi:hypothetical protein